MDEETFLKVTNLQSRVEDKNNIGKQQQQQYSEQNLYDKVTKGGYKSIEGKIISVQVCLVCHK